nr:hypothetical protein [uncultured Catonella sp.]
MLRVFELFKKIANLLLFTVAIGQIFIYESFTDSLERMCKVELLWRFLVNFGA